MNIKPSAAIRQNYNEIADLCRKTEESIFLTKNVKVTGLSWIIKHMKKEKSY